MNNLLGLVAEKYPLSVVEGAPGVMSYEIRSPAVSFRNFVFQENECLFWVSQRDHFDERQATAVIQVLRETSLLSSCGRDVITLIDAPNLGFSSFDTVCVLAGNTLSQFKYDIPVLQRLTNVVFPCHHSEFTKEDSAKDIRYVREKAVSTLNWRRQISPRVWLLFGVDGAGYTRGRVPLISSFSYLEEILSRRIGSGSGWARVRNYAGSIIDVVVDNGVIAAFSCEYEGYSSFRPALWSWLTTNATSQYLWNADEQKE